VPSQLRHLSHSRCHRLLQTARSPQQKKRRGRPPGSKNKPKFPVAVPEVATDIVEPEEAIAIAEEVVESSEVPVKRGRGRPKGSKNKPKPPSEEGAEPADPPPPVDPTKPRRGRPKGSKNKPKEPKPDAPIMDDLAPENLD